MAALLNLNLRALKYPQVPVDLADADQLRKLVIWLENLKVNYMPHAAPGNTRTLHPKDGVHLPGPCASHGRVPHGVGAAGLSGFTPGVACRGCPQRVLKGTPDM